MALKPVTSPEIFQARFERFLKDFAEYERKQLYHETMDNFLELYKHGDKRNWHIQYRLVALMFELNRLGGFTGEVVFN